MYALDGLSGAALVTRAGCVKLEMASGLADATVGTPCTSRTRFQVCSISKQFAAVAVMLLVESGELDLAEPVARWLPGCGPQWRRVTLHHLLTHTAGVRHWDDAPGFDPSQPMEPAKRAALMQQAPLLTDPGTRWHYSSPGYLLAGYIVEQASGQAYAAFLTEQVLVPLGLTATSAGSLPAGENAARGYRDGKPVPPWQTSAMPGTGDIWSTVGDLARFTAAIHSGLLITQRSLHAMLTPYRPLPDGEDSSDGWLTYDGYGYGLYIGRIAGQTAYFHTGDNPGYRSLAVWLPHQAASAVFLSNDEGTDTEALLRQLMPIALEGG
jgi:CubicO group peptidase (beta-lactamase class C family)